MRSQPDLRDAALRAAAAVMFLAVLAFILWGSLTPVTAPGGGRYDKIQHFVAYAALAAAGLAAAPRRPWPVLLVVTLIGAAVEVLQATLPLGRSGSLLDLLANVGGTSLSGAVWISMAARRGR